MTMRDKLRLIRQALGEGVVDVQGKTFAAGSRVAQSSARAKSMVALVFVGSYSALFAGASFAAGSGCNSAATTSLTTFISDAAKFMEAIGAAGALLMFAIGAFFIIAGGTGSRVSKGFGMIKNAVIGVVVLCAGFFVQHVVLSFVNGATSNNAGAGTPGCVTQGNNAVK